jgi:AcrR family transcriptional regulator
MGIAENTNLFFLCKNEHCSFMQIQKEDIRKTILLTARNEFLDKGFKDASVRSIAKKSGVGLSNIYNYFRNKDEIFREVLSVLLTALDAITEEHNSPENISYYVFDSEEYMSRQINMFAELIDNHKEDFRPLFFKASGSSLENYREEYTAIHATIGKEYIRLVKEKYPSVMVKMKMYESQILDLFFIRHVFCKRITN